MGSGRKGRSRENLDYLMIKAIIEAGKNVHDPRYPRAPQRRMCPARIREKCRSMTKDRFMDYQIQACLEESGDLDFLSHGRPKAVLLYGHGLR